MTWNGDAPVLMKVWNETGAVLVWNGDAPVLMSVVEREWKIAIEPLTRILYSVYTN